VTLLLRRGHALLTLGLLAPAVGAGAIVAAVIAFPDFDHAAQYISELGGAEAPKAWIFNLGMIACGLASAAAGVGFGLAVMGLGGSRVAAALVTVCFVLSGLGLVISGLIPWPDPRHLWVNLGLVLILAPPLMLWGLARVEGMRGLKLFLIAAMAAMALLALITRHLLLPGLVTDANVGWWERGFALVLAGWAAVAAMLLQGRLARELADRNAG
jgi:glucan biosynthesis protein C